MKTKCSLLFSLALSASVSLLFLPGCGGGIRDQQANQETSDTISQEFSLTPEARNLLYEFPTPFEVTTLLEQAKAGYIFDITNPVSNVGKYLTEKHKAISLGIYSADLAYSATYNHVDETNKFLGCTSKLADELGIAGVYQPDLIERVKQFNNNKDSLVNLVSRVFLMTNDFLSKNNRNQVSVYIASGAFTEGLYLASSLNLVAADNTLISGIIFKQQPTFERLLSILALYQHDASIQSVYAEIVKLKPAFTDYGIDAGTRIPQEKANELNDLVESVRNAFAQ